MNIVISSLTDMKVTGLNTGSKDLDSAKLFVSKTITDNIDLTLEGANGTYPLIKTLSNPLEKAEYLGYKLYSRVNVPDGAYSVIATGVDAEVTLELEGNNALTDEHDAVLIIGRNINPISTQILAQDINSQQFTFYIKKKYDGVSFIDETKRIFFDYIPVDPNDLPEGKEFISDPAIVITEDIIPPNGQEGEWIMLKWNLPYLATKMAGTVRFAVSVIDHYGDERSYTWQTFPSSFIISQNIGLRTGLTLTPTDESILDELVDNVQTLQTDVDAIEMYLGEQTDEDPANDKEILLIGGGAPIKEGTK